MKLVWITPKVNRFENFPKLPEQKLHKISSNAQSLEKNILEMVVLTQYLTNFSQYDTCVEHANNLHSLLLKTYKLIYSTLNIVMPKIHS